MQMRDTSKDSRLIQQVAENPRRGRFTTETQHMSWNSADLPHELRAEIQREQRRRKRQQETSGFLLGRESIV